MNRDYFPSPNIQELVGERESLRHNLKLLQEAIKMKENELNRLRIPLTNETSYRNASFIQIDSDKIQMLEN